MLNLFTLSAFTAFLSLIWKETVNTFPAFKNWIRRHLSVLARKPLFCGFCTTSWIAFFVTIAVSPLNLSFFLTWASIAIIALILRYIVIALEEAVHWQVHTLNGQPDDIH